MKKLLLIILISSVTGIQAMLTNSDFVRRFGSNSTIYNTPIYFGKGRDNNEDKKPVQKTKKPVRKNKPKQIPASYRQK